MYKLVGFLVNRCDVTEFIRRMKWLTKVNLDCNPEVIIFVVGLLFGKSIFEGRSASSHKF